MKFLKLLKIIPFVLAFIVGVAALSIGYGFVVHGIFTLRYIFDANFLAGIVLVVIGIVLMFVPSSFAFKSNMLLDSSTFIERSYDNREIRQEKARLVLWFGIFTIILTGLIQLLLSYII